MGRATEDLADLWRWFLDNQFRGYSPLYTRVAEAVAGDDGVLATLLEAPADAHLPPAPLGAVRYLLLDGLDHPLAAVYDGTSDADPGPLFLDVCRVEADAVLDLLQTRRVQTNDCGRCAVLAPALTWVAGRAPGPYTLLDVGTSAGLNLLGDRYRLDYGPHGATGPADSPVTVACEVDAGTPPIAASLPPLADRLGLDRSPLDLRDPTDARWLSACVWPDTGRSDRVEASIRLAQQDLPRLVTGEANATLPHLLAGWTGPGTTIVTTSSAFGYFPPDQRGRFVDLLTEASSARTIAWISSESGGVVESLTSAGPRPPEGVDALGVVLFEDGAASAHLLGHAHPHGNRLTWLAPA